MEARCCRVGGGGCSRGFHQLRSWCSFCAFRTHKMLRRVPQHGGRGIVHRRRRWPAVMPAKLRLIHHLGIFGRRVHGTGQFAVRMAVRMPRGIAGRGRVAVSGAAHASVGRWRRWDRQAAERRREATAAPRGRVHHLIQRRVDTRRRQRLCFRCCARRSRHSDRWGAGLGLRALLPRAEGDLSAVGRRVGFEGSFPGRRR